MSLREHTDLPTRKLHRLAARTPKKGLFWCWRCDRDVVGKGQACRTCGARNGRRTMRKGEVV